jgi:hypothetical protein
LTDSTSQNTGVNRRDALIAAAMASTVPAKSGPAQAYPVTDDPRVGARGCTTRGWCRQY